MERVLQLLSESRDKIAVIAPLCGFSSEAILCRVFKAHTGLSPDAWRKSRLPRYMEPPEDDYSKLSPDSIPPSQRFGRPR